MSYIFDFTILGQLKKLNTALLNVFDEIYRKGPQNYVEFEDIRILTDYENSEGKLEIFEFEIDLRYGRFYEEDNDLNFSRNFKLVIDYMATIEGVCETFKQHLIKEDN